METHNAFKTQTIGGRTKVKTALLAQQPYRMAVTLTRCFGVGVDEIVVISLCKQLAKLLFNGVGIAVFVGEYLGRYRACPKFQWLSMP